MPNIPMNISKKPLQQHGVASRCQCAICGQRPADVTASGGKDGAPVTIRVQCCGRSETRTVSRDELLFTQRFFLDEVDDGGDAHEL